MQLVHFVTLFFKKWFKCDFIYKNVTKYSFYLGNLVNIKLFVKKRAFFSKNMVFKHFWTPFPFPVAKVRNFLPQSA